MFFDKYVALPACMRIEPSAWTNQPARADTDAVRMNLRPARVWKIVTVSENGTNTSADIA